MATVKRLAKNSYEVRWDEYSLDGKRHQRRKHFDRAGEANDFADSLNRDTPYDASRITVGEWLEKWAEMYMERLEATTQIAYRRIIERWTQAIGRVKLAELKPSHIDRFYAALTSPKHPLSTKPLSSSTVQRHHAVMHRALKMAIRDGLLDRNPLDLVDRPKNNELDLQLPDMKDVQAQVDALAGTALYLPVVLALMTGMRQSEVLGLRWDLVDLEGGVLHVRRVRQRLGAKALEKVSLNAYTRLVPDMPGWIERERTKSKHNRSIYLAAPLVALLKRARLRQRELRMKYGPGLYFASDYVCTYEDGQPMGDSELSHAMQKVCRYHDLRHINGTQLLIAGFSPADVAELLGHTTPTTTLRFYAHSVAEQRKLASETMAGLVKLGE